MKLSLRRLEIKFTRDMEVGLLGKTECPLEFCGHSFKIQPMRLVVCFLQQLLAAPDSMSRRLSWTQPGFGGMKTGGGYWVVKKVLLSGLEVLMRSKTDYSRNVSGSELVQGWLVEKEILNSRFHSADTCNEKAYVIIMDVGGCEERKNRSMWW